MTEPTLRQLQERVLQFAAERDWGQFHAPRNVAMALSVEAAELLELFLWTPDGDALTPDRRARVADEAADVLMCLLNLAARANIDLPAALDEKLRRAELKYPVDRVKGRSLKYDEYPEWVPTQDPDRKAP